MEWKWGESTDEKSLSANLTSIHARCDISKDLRAQQHYYQRMIIAKNKENKDQANANREEREGTSLVQLCS